MIADAIADGVAALDDSLHDDGLPAPCQNAWEDMTGRFAHTAATYLTAYGSVARTDFDADLAAHAADQARAVLDGLDAPWSADRGAYALRLDDGERDDRLDASTFALVDAVATADAVTGRRRPTTTLTNDSTTTVSLRFGTDGIERSSAAAPFTGQYVIPTRVTALSASFTRY